jgi:hypothetical protein
VLPSDDAVIARCRSDRSKHCDASSAACRGMAPDSSITDDLAGEVRGAIGKTLNQIGRELTDGDTVLVVYNPRLQPGHSRDGVRG